MLNEIIVGIREAIEAAVPDISVYHTDPTAHEDDFPIIIFNLEVASPVNFMGGGQDIIGSLFVSYFDESDLGSGSLRDIEEVVYAALHKQDFTALGYSGTALWNMERRETRILKDANLLTCDDVYQIFGSKD
jgi:hypothetical protein